jgi:putative endonuclease
MPSAIRTATTSSSSRPKPRNAAERRAARWYRLRGYRLLATNAWIAGAELDLVARRGRTVVFCEVKSKSGPRYGDPLEMVTAEKVRRLRRAAAAWLARHPQQGRLVLRFDVVSVRPGRTTCLKNAF